jgi:hypothetical protein
MSFSKTENRKVKQVLSGVGISGGSGGGKTEEKDCRRGNMVEILGTHV